MNIFLVFFYQLELYAVWFTAESIGLVLHLYSIILNNSNPASWRLYNVNFCFGCFSLLIIYTACCQKKLQFEEIKAFWLTSLL